eukprot:gene32996-40724_t
MLSAVGRENDAVFQGNLQKCRDEVIALEAEYNALLEANRVKRLNDETDLTLMIPIIETLSTEIRNKWRGKFSFMQVELGEQYAHNVECVINIACVWLRYVMSECSQRGVTVFYTEFKKYYPAVWERFLSECDQVDVF